MPYQGEHHRLIKLTAIHRMPGGGQVISIQVIAHIMHMIRLGAALEVGAGTHAGEYQVTRGLIDGRRHVGVILACAIMGHEQAFRAGVIHGDNLVRLTAKESLDDH